MGRLCQPETARILFFRGGRGDPSVPGRSPLSMSNPFRWLTPLFVAFAPGVAQLPAQSQPSALPDVPWHLTARPWQPVNQPRGELLDKVENIVNALAPYQYWNAANPGDVRNGEITDPYRGSEWQYATPYFAFASAMVVSEGRSPQLLTAAIRAMDHATADIAGLDDRNEDGGKANDNHGEFFCAPMVKALRLLTAMQQTGAFPALTPELIQKWRTRMGASRDTFLNFNNLNNWRTYASKGEWLRAQEGLIPKADAVSWIESNWLTSAGGNQRGRFVRDRDTLGLSPYFLIYHDDDPGPRQNFAYLGGATGNLTDMIANGYDGPSRDEMAATLDYGARSSLLLMAGNGDAAASGRTGDHVWNDIVFGNLFDRAAERAKTAGNMRLAGQFRRAAMLAFRSAWRFQQEQGFFSVTKNQFHPSLNVYYADWSALTNYNGYVEIHTAESYQNRVSVIPEHPTPAEIGGYSAILDSQFAHVFLNAGGHTVQLCTDGSTAANNTGNQLWHTLGIARFSRPGWDTRLGPGDAWTRLDLTQAISFSPAFLEGGAWKAVAQLPGRFVGRFTPEFTHPLLVRGTLRIAPRAGQTGPTFDLKITVTPDGTLVDTVRTGTETFGVIWPVLSFDGRSVLDVNVSARSVTTAFPKVSTPVVRQAEQAILSGGTSVVASSAVKANGTGYVTFPANGGIVQWTGIEGGTGGRGAVGVRFSLPSGTRTMTLRVNGTTLPLNFNSTSAVSDWHSQIVPVDLLAGATNTVSLESTGAGGVNLDELRSYPVNAAQAEPDQQAFLALDADPVIDASAPTMRAAYGDLRPVRVTAGGSTQTTFVYPRTAADPATAAVQGGFTRTTNGFTTPLGRVEGDIYVGRWAAGGRGTSVDLNGDGAPEVTFDASCDFVVQHTNGVPIAIEADRYVNATVGGRTLAVGPFAAGPIPANADDPVWQYRPLPGVGERDEITTSFTPATTDREIQVGFGRPDADAPVILAGVRFGDDGNVTPIGVSGASFPYQAGVSCRVRLVVDIPGNRYSLYLKPAGASERRLVGLAPLPSGFSSVGQLTAVTWFGPAGQAGPGPVGNLPSGETAYAKINFQTPTSATPSGYLADTGAVFAARGNGLSYGWIGGDNTAYTRDRDAVSSPDQRYDTLAHLGFGNPQTYTNTWELAVPAGSYRVRVVAGDPSFTDSYYNILAEGVATVNAAPTTNWREGTVVVPVTDGRLTISNGPSGQRNKICFIEVSSVLDPFPYQSFESWVAASFPGGAADPRRGAALDPDGDGRSNLLEYATGGSPLLADGAGAFSLGWESGSPPRPTVRFFRRAATLFDLTYEVWQSTDLARWTRLWSSAEDSDFTSPLVSPGDPAQDGFVTVTVPSPADPPRRFFQLRVTRP